MLMAGCRTSRNVSEHVSSDSLQCDSLSSTATVRSLWTDSLTEEISIVIDSPRLTTAADSGPVFARMNARRIEILAVKHRNTRAAQTDSTEIHTSGTVCRTIDTNTAASTSFSASWPWKPLLAAAVLAMILLALMLKAKK